jgi:hypothetical protein
MKPIETGKRGETVSLPTVADYLAEICKEDNVDVNEYLAKHNETRTLEVKKDWTKDIGNVLGKISQNSIHNPSMEYTWKDRIKSVWLVLKNLKYSRYNLFDFKKYQEFGPHDFVATSLSTPLSRFKKFIKNQWYEIKWAWNYTPAHIAHFKKNKPRISWFEEKVQNLFFLNWDDNKNQTINELKEKGYQVENNRIWHEPIPLDDDKRII